MLSLLNGMIQRIFHLEWLFREVLIKPLLNIDFKKKPAASGTVKSIGLTVERMGGIDACPDELNENNTPKG